MPILTAAQRNRLPAADFAGPGESYPIPDANHARNALSRAAQFANPAERRAIEAKVHAKFPGIGSGSARAEAMRRARGQ